MDMPISSSIASPTTSKEAVASWAAVASVGIGAFALVTTEFLPVGLLPSIAIDMGVTEGQAGLMVTTPGVLAAIAAPATIAFARKFDRKHVLIFLLGLLVLSNLIVATASNFYALMFGRILLGIGVGGFWTVGGSLGPRLRPGPEGARATSLIYSGVSLGTVAGVPAGALIGDIFGWRLSFVLASAVSVLVVLALATLLPSIKPQNSAGLTQVPTVLRSRKSQVGLVAAALIFIGQFGAYTYITPFLNQISHISAGVLSALLLGYGIAGFTGNLAGGYFVGKSLFGTLAAAAALIAISTFGLALTGVSPVFAIIWTLVWGFGFGVLPIALQTYIFSSAPDKLEAIAALFVSVAQLSIGAGALVGGLTVDSFGVSAAMVLGGSSALMTAILVVSARKL